MGGMLWTVSTLFSIAGSLLVALPVVVGLVRLPPAPSFLSCEGAGYEPEWGSFKATLRRAGDGPRGQLADKAAFGETRLLGESLNRMQACQTQASEFVQSWHKAYWAIRRAAEKGEQADVAALVAQSGPQGGARHLAPWLGLPLEADEPHFCLVGCAVAVWIAGLSEREISRGDGEAVLNLVYMLLGVGVPWSLGTPFRWGDSFLPAFGQWGGWERPTVPELLAFRSYESSSPPAASSSFVLGGPQPFSALSLLRKLLPCDPLRDACWMGARLPGDRRPLTVTVVGHHAAGCLALTLAMQDAAKPPGEGGFQLEVRYAGAYYLCHVLNEEKGGSTSKDHCVMDDVKDFMRKWIGGLEGIEVQLSAAGAVQDTADSLRMALARTHGPQETDLYLCMDQVVFCWLLRRRATNRILAPMMLGIGMSFHQDVPKVWRDELAADVALWASSEGASPTGRDLIWTCNQHIVLQAFWQLGVQVPWIDTPGLAHWSGVQYSPPSSVSLLVLRSPFWRLPSGLAFRALLEHLFLPQHGIELRWMDSFMRGSLEAASYAGSWVSFQDMAQYTAALYVSPELYQIKLRDMYAMGVPILAPAASWGMRTLREMFRMWGMLNTDFMHRAPSCLGPRGEWIQGPQTPSGSWCVEHFPRSQADEWPFGAPFLDIDEDHMDKLGFYYSLVDSERYPYILHFDSLAELYSQLHVAAEHGRALGQLMRSFFQRQVVENADRFCKEALTRLLSPAV